MKDELKIKYFKNVFEVFASAAEGRYPFYADYLSDEVYYSDAAVEALGLKNIIRIPKVHWMLLKLEFTRMI